MTTPMSSSVQRLDDHPRWEPAVRARLEAFLAACALERTSVPAAADAPFAVFDWDHTLLHGDIGDAIFLHMARHSLFFRPRDWRHTSAHLTPEALDALARCTPPGAVRLPGPDGAALTRELVSIYLHHRTTDGQGAFSGYDPEFTHPSYAWCASLLAGFTPERIVELTREVLGHLLDRPPGATGELAGLSGWDDWARPAAPMIDLARKLEQAGLPVWIVSASPQIVVETCAREVGLSPERVIGVRNRAVDGTLTTRLEPCRGREDVIPYCLGKRCWIQRILGSPAEPGLDPPDGRLGGRLWFAAGDSDGDLAFLQDADRLRLVIAHRDNRSVRLARNDEDGRWLVNPPFFGA